MRFSKEAVMTRWSLPPLASSARAKPESAFHRFHCSHKLLHSVDEKLRIQKAVRRTTPVAPYKEMVCRYPKRMPIVRPGKEPSFINLNGTVCPDVYL